MVAGPYCPHKESMFVRANSISNFECFEHRPATKTFNAENFENINYSEPSFSTFDEEGDSQFNYTEPVNVQEVQVKSVSVKKSVSVEKSDSVEQPKMITTDESHDGKGLENKIEVRKPVELRIKPAASPENKSDDSTKDLATNIKP